MIRKTSYIYVKTVAYLNRKKSIQRNVKQRKILDHNQKGVRVLGIFGFDRSELFRQVEKCKKSYEKIKNKNISNPKNPNSESEFDSESNKVDSDSKTITVKLVQV